ncbi:MBL fold metallo-hydrolase [Oerskovia sp. M15]
MATAEIWTSTTTVVVAPDGRCLVVDPGITVDEVESLAATISRRGWRVTAGFSTHPHWDHVLWASSLGDVPAGPARRRCTPRSGAAPRTWPRSSGRRPGTTSRCSDGSRPPSTPASSSAVGASPDAVRLPWPGAPAGATSSGAARTPGGGQGAGEPVVLVVEHQAHAPGHGALVLPGAGVIVVGDMLSDLEVPLLDLESPDPVGDHRAGLEVLEHAISEHGVHTLVRVTGTCARAATRSGSGSGPTGPTSTTWRRPQPPATTATARTAPRTPHRGRVGHG